MLLPIFTARPRLQSLGHLSNAWHRQGNEEMPGLMGGNIPWHLQRKFYDNRF
jgi:hypothetical protein